MAKYRIVCDTQTEKPMYYAEKKYLFLFWEYVSNTVGGTAEKAQEHLERVLKSKKTTVKEFECE